MTFSKYSTVSPDSGCLTGVHGGNSVCQAVQTEETSHHHSVFQERRHLQNKRRAAPDVPRGQREALPAARIPFQGNYIGQDYN